ncbi:hypothetical protein HUJ04_007015 [Dendroctonus ponderosae]|uniref:Uncharacterized protein n=1 Tax=Dendroctonus ponderosae TaxID=77166 RepID=A0AAR5PJA8_DENPD|nr:hypothetical protein HUJ04_007015 [Dendroctonus ponderosae]
MKKVRNDLPAEKISISSMAESFIEQNYRVLLLLTLCIAGIVAFCVIYATFPTPSVTIRKISLENANIFDQISYCVSCNLQCELFEMNKTKPKVFKPQSTCPYRNKKKQFTALALPRFYCTLEDVTNPEARKIPIIYQKQLAKNNSNNETQSAVVNYIIAALLLTSLGAALLEFYRAKTSRNKKNESKGAKAPLNKKCSLADLTVLKHHRRELVRRESILEPHCEDEGNYQQHQGFQPSPLQRRCSFPASLSSSDDTILGRVGYSRRNSRKLSMTGDFRRRMSAVNEVRKLSILPDDEVWRRGSLIGEDSSPERRAHHSRLVHRH